MLGSTSPAVSSGKEPGLLSQMAAGNRAYPVHFSIHAQLMLFGWFFLELVV